MWNCEACTYKNKQWSKRCKICQTSKLENLGAYGGKEDVFQVDKETDWHCPQCTIINQSKNIRCRMCHFDIGNSKYQEGHSPAYIGNESDVENEIRVVLIGRTGSGKSATGNSLLGSQSFQSLVSGSSVTSKCKRGEQWRDGKRVVVVDTPGLFDTGMTNEKVTKEIVKCIGMTSPGPHAMVLVVGIGRFTKEEQDTVQHFVDHFGEGMLQYMIVLFTRNDELTKRNQSIHQYVQGVPNELKDLLQQCGNRYIALNNDAHGQEMEGQVNTFYEMVNKMVRDNGGSCYTSELYQEAEATIQRRMHEQRQKLEREKEKEKQEIERKVQGKYEHKLTQEILEKSKLEDELKHKQNEEKKIREENINLESTIQNLKQRIEKASGLKSDKDKEETRRMERQIEKLQEQLAQNERRNSEKEIRRLKKAYEDAERKNEKQIKEMRKEMQKLSRQKDEEYKEKMSTEALRRNERDDVETEKNGILDDLAGGFKKLGAGALKLGKKVLGFFGF